MKKIKWYLIAVAVIGIGSAFGTKPGVLNLYGKVSANDFVKLDPAKENGTGAGSWSCDQIADTCRFQPGDGINAGDPIGTHYTRAQMAGPVASTIGKKLSLTP